VVLLEAEGMQCGKKTTSEFRPPSSCMKSGKIELELYGKETVEWS
jgi:hypothetical protein